MTTPSRTGSTGSGPPKGPPSERSQDAASTGQRPPPIQRPRYRPGYQPPAAGPPPEPPRPPQPVGPQPAAPATAGPTPGPAPGPAPAPTTGPAAAPPGPEPHAHADPNRPSFDNVSYAPWQTPPGSQPAPKKVPGSGWRGAVYGLSGRTINLGLSPAERQLERWLRAIDEPVRNHCVATMNVKGGAGKTTTTIALGTAFAMHRRDQCIGIDANPDRGNLAQRIGQEHLYSVRDLLDHITEITGAHQLRRFTNQAGSRFEAIASDRDPVKARAFTPDEYRTVLAMMRAFRQVILTDTGIDLTNPVVDAVLDNTDTLVIASSSAQDVAGLAWETLDSVEQRGYDGLVKNAVISIVDETGGDQVPMSELVAAFRERCRSVVVIPHERSLVGGGLFSWEALSGRTRRAYLRLAATVAEDFTGSSPWPR